MEVLERFRVGSRLPHVACVASVSARFRSKDQGTKVKDRAKNGASKKAERGFIVWLSFHLSRGQNRSFFAPKPNGNACYAGYGKREFQCTTWPSFPFFFTVHYVYHKISSFMLVLSIPNCFGLFLAASFLFWKILLLNLLFAVSTWLLNWVSK